MVSMDKEIRVSSASDSERPDISGHEKDFGDGAAAGAPLSRPSSLAIPTPPAVPDAGPHPAPDDIPDGGLDAWLQVIGGWVILLATWGLVNSFGVYQTYYETTLLTTSTSSAISWIGSVQAALLTIVGTFSGPLYDAGYFRHLIIAGMFFIVLGQFMTSLCSTYWQVLLAQGFTTGIGMGLSFLPSAAILAQYFKKRRALALGISSTGSPIAGIIFPVIFSRLEPVVGFGWATRVIAFILLATSAIPIAFMRTRLPPPRRRRSIVDPTAFRDAPFLLVVGSLFFDFLGLYVPFFYIQLFTEKKGLAGPDFSPYLVTLLNVGSIFGRVLPNALADAAGNLNVLLACSLVSAVLALAWLAIGNLAGLVAFALLYGLFSGGIVSVTPSVIMSLTPDLGRVGARLGTTFLATGLAVLVGTPIGGAILGSADGEPRWGAMIGYAGATLMVSSLACTLSRAVLYRKRGGWID
jgi:MFS family permease